ncbi:MAG: hypothetical protein QOE96_1902 [Blastocatellia bacterium]|nr:hypothetical protein [Blastocatellia bacterium]
MSNQDGAIRFEVERSTTDEPCVRREIKYLLEGLEAGYCPPLIMSDKQGGQ